MRGRLLLGFLMMALLAGSAAGEPVRLRSGDLLQGEVLEKQADEKGFAFHLFRTGGVFRLRWDQLIEVDEKRLRDRLGLNPWDESEVPLMPGHTVILKNTKTQMRGLALNKDELDRELEIRTPTGVRSIPRDQIREVRNTMVEVLEVFTVEELYAQYVAEHTIETPGDNLEAAKYCVQIGAHREAESHLLAALADADFTESDQAQQARNLLDRTKVLIRAEDALDRKRSVKQLRFQKRFDEALAEIDELRDQYEENATILKILNLDRLRRETVSARRKHFRSDIRRRFFKILDLIVSEKIREKDENDEMIGLRAIQQWASNARGMAAEIFSRIAEQTGLDEQEAREFWEDRSKGRVRRYNYGAGTFAHPDVRDRVRKAMAVKKAPRRGARRPGARGKPKVKSDSEWWSALGNKEAKRNFVKAWFAEFGPGVLQVLRIETRTCKNCGGRGITISQNASGSDEIRLPCAVCTLAGHERIVICR